jgi:exonuclease III
LELLKSKTNILYFNIAGLSTNFIALRHIVEIKNPMIVFLAETHIVEIDAFDQYSIPGYKNVACLSYSRHTGGVAIYVKDSVQFNIRHNEYVDGNWLLGITVVRGMFPGNYGVLYHSPSTSDQRFIDILENWLDLFLDSSKLNILAGDFNINWLDVSNSFNLQRLANFFNLKQIVNEYTRISRHSRTLIDHVFCNLDNVFSFVDNALKITDHETLIINIFNDSNSSEHLFKLKCWKKYSKQALCNLVERSVDFLSAADNVSESAAVLTNVLKSCTNKLVQQKFVTLKNSNSWYNLDLLRLKRKRDKLYKMFYRSNSQSHWNMYTIARNRYSQSLKTTRCEYIQNKIDQHQNNSKELWKILKSLLKPSNSCPRTITFNGTLEESEQAIATKFNNYFINSVKSINESIEMVDEPIELIQPINNNYRLQGFHPITLNDLREICFSLKNTAGIDNVNTRVIQDCFHVIGHVLLDLINKSLLTGQVPQIWKESLVVPIQKVAGTIKAEEFRPINMLHTLEKNLELVVKGQLTEYLNNNVLLIPEQSGYRESHSCETALNLVIAKWKEYLENKNIIVAVFLDLKRAFETISRPLLLKTLKRFGITGTAYKWFENYLSGRTQRTIFNDFISDPVDNNLGVPQGSVLGPLLFIMYINDMKRVLRSCDLNLFADDTVLFIAAKNFNDAVSHINTDLHYLSRWLKYKQLKLNISKTKCMIISRIKLNINVSVKIDAEEIERVREMKYLGVIIDDKLKFNAHIDNVIKKIAKKFGILCRLKNFLTINSKIQLYKSIISPHLDFCSSILFLANETQMSRLQRLQNKVMRLILRCNRFTSSSFMLDALQWLSVKQRIIYLTMVFIFKVVNNLLPRYLCSRIERGSDIHSYGTRNADALRTPNFLTCASQNSLFYKGINVFNSMPRQIKRASTIMEFKRQCISHVKTVF